MKNLFVVRTPLQLINALEAKHHFGTQNNLLIIIYSVIENDNVQMKKLLDPKDWDEVLEVNKKPKKSVFFEYLPMIYRLKKEKFEHLFLVYFKKGIQKLLMANLDYKHLYLIDDGVATLAIQESLQKKEKTSLKDLRYKLLGLQTKVTTLPNLFTVYQLHPLPSQKIVQNQYQYLKNHFFETVETESQQSVYLLGQNLIKSEIMTLNNYMKYLKKTLQHYSNQSIIYVPHRHEREEDLEVIKEYFKDANFTIQNFNGAIEIELLVHKIVPYTIVSFFTSALFNLKKIFTASDIVAVYIEPQDIISRHEAIKGCYISLSDEEITTLKL